MKFWLSAVALLFTAFGQAHGAEDPGEHHLCAAWQKKPSYLRRNGLVAALHFTAEPGTTYYFRVRNAANSVDGSSMAFAPLDSDEGQLLVGKFALSAFSLRK